MTSQNATLSERPRQTGPAGRQRLDTGADPRTLPDLPTLASILRCSRWKAYKMARTGQWEASGIQIIRIGSGYHLTAVYSGSTQYASSTSPKKTLTVIR